MAMSQKQRDEVRREKAAKLGEEDLRLKVRAGTKQALADLMQWAGLSEQGEALTLMIHHLAELREGPTRYLLRHEMAGAASVAREPIRFTVRPGTRSAVDDLALWTGLPVDRLIECAIHAIRALPRHQAVKFLAPPQHVVAISPRLQLEFHQRSLLMIQQDPGDEVIQPFTGPDQGIPHQSPPGLTP